MKNGKCSVKGAYNGSMQFDSRRSQSLRPRAGLILIWAMYAPLKMQTMAWRLLRNRLAM